jgi:hypothetical protein
VYTHIVALSGAETARARDFRALLESGGGLEAAKAARAILDPLSGGAAAGVREGFEQYASRAMADTPPGCSGGTGAGDAGLRHVFACIGHQGEETPSERVQIKRLWDAAAAAQATATAARAELRALEDAIKEAGSAPSPSEAGRKQQLLARATEAAATAKHKGKTAHALARRAAFRPATGVAEDARSAAAAALAFATRAGANAGIQQARLEKSRAHSQASFLAREAAAAEKELEVPRGASAERPEEEVDDDEEEMAEADKWVQRAKAELATVKQNLNAPRPLLIENPVAHPLLLSCAPHLHRFLNRTIFRWRNRQAATPLLTGIATLRR